MQQMRFLAAALVLIGHTLHEVYDQFGMSQNYEKMFEWGVGVDIFFVISGFIMYLTSASFVGVRGYPVEFLKRRFERIVPLYWLFTSLMIISSFAVPSAVTHGNLSIFHVISSYSFVPWPRADGAIRPVLALGWTLNYEMFFYIMFAAMLTFKRSVFLYVLSLIFVVLSVCHNFVPEQLWIIDFWTNPIVLEFLAGVWLGWAFKRGLRIPGIAGLALMLLGILGLVVAHSWPIERVLKAGLPAVLIFAGWTFRPNSGNSIVGRFAAYGGDLSYAIYLSHPFSLNVAALIFHRLDMNSPWLFFFSSIAAAVCAGALVHHTIEHPLINFFRLRRQRDRPSGARLEEMGR
ncbi:hypothetical protein CSW59_00485 [Caulobacter sp. BP25]|nr:hypothetical protein CSW59_00485 [Caulobacter sp. BP25]